MAMIVATKAMIRQPTRNGPGRMGAGLMRARTTSPHMHPAKHFSSMAVPSVKNDRPCGAYVIGASRWG